MARRDLTAERLRSVLSYDPGTGQFVWLVRRGSVSPGSRAGHLDPTTGYVSISIDGVSYRAHRLAWLFTHGQWPQECLDHKDGDRANNRLDNLRPADNSQNAANSARNRNNTSGFKGVTFHRRRADGSRPWQASIRKDGQLLFLGNFATPLEARDAYEAAALEHFGEFARVTP